MSSEKKNKVIKKSSSKNKKLSFLKRGFSAFSESKKKNLYRYAMVLALGISLIPIGLVFGSSFQLYTDDDLVVKRFPLVLSSVKNKVERVFDTLIEDMKEDPLDGLYVDKLPSAEEIFFAEWAEDGFPKVEIPVIGGYIERMGAESVGDIDLDNQFNSADLNISSSKKPSGLCQAQCQVLWSSEVENSLISSKYSIWFSALEGNLNNRESLKLNFNLTEFQLNLICNWISVGQNTWIRYLSREERFEIIPLLFFGLIIPSGVLIGYGTLKVRPEIKKLKHDKVSELKEKSKPIK